MSDNSKLDYIFKYIIIGNAAVGKSNLLLRYVKNSFQENYQITIGLEFAYKNLIIQDLNCRIQIWDTAGMECFRSISRGYYQSSVCAVIVYDITNRESFKNVKHWIEECQINAPKTISMILVGNKSDLNDMRTVSEDEGKLLAENNGMTFYETSAKSGKSVTEMFEQTAEEVVKKIKEGYYNLEDDNCGIKKGLGKKGPFKENNKKQILKNNKEAKKRKCCF